MDEHKILAERHQQLQLMGMDRGQVWQMSLQFLLLGLLGEYIGRLYEDSRGRPLFLLSMTVGEGLASQATAPITDFNSENPAPSMLIQ
jgi:hypothetical protein